MSFNSYIFIVVFFPAVLVGYFVLNKWNRKKAAVWYLTGMSLLFCGYWSVQSVAVLLFSVFLNYGICKWMCGMSGRNRKRLLILGISADVGILFCFKYYNFFVENVNGMTGLSIPGWELAMPLGISFYTFGQLSYLVDSYNGECPTASFSEYMLSAVFFPKLVQGPIMRFGDLILQLREESRKRPDFRNLGRGLYVFSMGLAKKVLLADSVAKIVDIGYNDPEVLGCVEALLVMVCYSLQIYFDFSGYCDMAYGVGCALNIELPQNFNSPYKAASISEFWDRWHMTLTRFFTRYVYIPLGGSRRGTVRTLVNTMIVFLLSGFWHGANWTFLVWGVLHGTWMIMERVTGYEKWKVPHSLKVLWTFVLNTFAWSIFRAESLSQVLKLWSRLFVGGINRIGTEITSVFNDAVEIRMLVRLGVFPNMEAYPGIPAMLLAAVLLVACFFMRNTTEKTELLNWNGRKMLVTAGLLFWSVISLADITQFLYVNF